MIPFRSPHVKSLQTLYIGRTNPKAAELSVYSFFSKFTATDDAYFKLKLCVRTTVISDEILFEGNIFVILHN